VTSAGAADLDALLAGEDLTEDRAADVMTAVMSGDLDPAVVAALLVALRAKGETEAELAGFVRAMAAAATPVPLDPDVRGRAVDTCGTGGDGAGTVNVSTIAAFVAAAAGVPVVKHGNRAASSRVGSADLLEAWGGAIELGPEAAASVLAEVGLTFLFARTYHPAMRHVAPVRAALRVRTVFNLLGPLSSPAGVTRQVVGVPDVHAAAVVAGALARLGRRHALVVRGDDGLDELTTTTTSRVWEVRDGTVREWVLDPSELGLARARPEDLRGGDLATNRARADEVLGGRSGPVADLVLLNAAAALVVGGAAGDLAEGLAVARAVVADGRAGAARDAWVARSRAAAGVPDEVARPA
jgi:anthranilate phosphoribosyltransferase